MTLSRPLQWLDNLAVWTGVKRLSPVYFLIMFTSMLIMFDSICFVKGRPLLLLFMSFPALYAAQTYADRRYYWIVLLASAVSACIVWYMVGLDVDFLAVSVCVMIGALILEVVHRAGRYREMIESQRADRARRLEHMTVVRLRLSQAKGVDSGIERALQEFAQLLDFRHIAFYRAEGKDLQLHTQSGWPQAQQRIQLHVGLPGAALRSGQPQFAHLSSHAREGDAQIAVPVMNLGKPYGVIFVFDFDTVRKLESQDIATLSLLSAEFELMLMRLSLEQMTSRINDSMRVSVAETA